ncbi:MAG: nucleotide exchange factor GrpE [Spirochaetaceae bacterium]|nr:nucleotide exchange factor GrpE [Spirochaetaceae bacterium]
MTKEKTEEIEVEKNEEVKTNPAEDQIEEQVGEPSLEEKCADLEKQVAELKDQYLRKVADFDNYRKRMIREKQEAFDYANANLLTDLLTTLDDFDRALSATEGTEGNASIVQGVQMINKQLRSMLESKYALTCYGEVGDIFDYDKYEAIGSSNGNVEEPTCKEIFLKGYMLKERVIRPAKVFVEMPEGNKK